MQGLKKITVQALLITAIFPVWAYGGFTQGEDTAAASGGGQLERSLIAFSVKSNSWLSLTGTTNLNSFECLSGSVNSPNFLFTESNYHQNRIYFDNARILVEVSSFDCKNPLINRDMYNALGGSKNPNIEIKLEEIIPSTRGSGLDSGIVTANVLITINGKTKSTELDIEWESPDGYEYQFKGSKDLLMSDFGIDPPLPAFGLIRVDDKINVEFNYIVQPGIISRVD
jgi:hypothetical protein